METNAATMNAASTLAAPHSSSVRLGGGDRFPHNDQAGEQYRTSANPGDDEATIAPHLQHRGLRRQRRGPTGGQRVTPGRKARHLPGGVDAPDLHRHGCDAGRTQHQNNDQRCNGQGRLDRTEPAACVVMNYPRVLNARPMMLVRAPTIESPVTTL